MLLSHSPPVFSHSPPMVHTHHHLSGAGGGVGGGSNGGGGACRQYDPFSSAAASTNASTSQKYRNAAAANALRPLPNMFWSAAATMSTSPWFSSHHNLSSATHYSASRAAAAKSYAAKLPRRPCLVIRHSSAAATTQSSLVAAALESSSSSSSPLTTSAVDEVDRVVNGGGHDRDDDDSDDDVLSRAADTSGVLLMGDRLKKRVVFADDHGMALTQVRVMTEPSNVPPLLWGVPDLTKNTKEDEIDNVVEISWQIQFKQPAADYLSFRQRLTQLKVSLENIFIDDAKQRIVGTIKVCNLTYDKAVFIRHTTNEWRTHKDVSCTYYTSSASASVTCGSACAVQQSDSTDHVAPAHAPYDTFAFQLSLPATTSAYTNSIEFCVCFRCGADEHWDNNNGVNYKIVRTQTLKSNKDNKAMVVKNELVPVVLENYSSDLLNANGESWSEFASWTHLENVNPYW